MTPEEKKLRAREKRLKKLLPEGFAEGVESSSTDEIKAAIVAASMGLSEVEAEQEKDEKLAALKETLKDLNGAYNDTKKVYRAKVKFCVQTLESRGVK